MIDNSRTKFLHRNVNTISMTSPLKVPRSVVSTNLNRSYIYKKPVKFVACNYNWIMFTFHWDGTVVISSNCTKMDFLSSMFWVRDHYSLAGAVNFVFKWMSLWKTQYDRRWDKDNIIVK